MIREVCWLLSISERYSQMQDKCVPMQIVVHGLPWSTEWQELKDLAKEHGDVIKADVMRRPDGKSRGFGTVVFKTPEDAQSAIEVSLVLPAPLSEPCCCVVQVWTSAAAWRIQHRGTQVACRLCDSHLALSCASFARILACLFFLIMLCRQQLRTTQGLNGLDFEARKLSAKLDQYN